MGIVKGLCLENGSWVGTGLEKVARPADFFYFGPPRDYYGPARRDTKPGPARHRTRPARGHPGMEVDVEFEVVMGDRTALNMDLLDDF